MCFLAWVLRFSDFGDFFAYLGCKKFCNQGKQMKNDLKTLKPKNPPEKCLVCNRP